MEKAELIIAVSTQGVPTVLENLSKVEQAAARAAEQLQQVYGLGSSDSLLNSLYGSGSSLTGSWLDLGDWNPEDTFSELSNSLSDLWSDTLADVDADAESLFVELEDGILDGFTDMSLNISDGWQDLTDGMADDWQDWLGDNSLWDGLSEALDDLEGIDLGDLTDGLGGWLDDLTGFDLDGLFGDFSSLLGGLGGFDLSGLFGDLSDWVGGLLDLDFGSLLEEAWEGLSDLVDLDGLVDSVSDGIGDVADLVGDTVGDLFDGLFGGGYTQEEALQRVENSVQAAERVYARITESLAAGNPIIASNLEAIEQAMRELAKFGTRAGYSSEQIEEMSAQLQGMITAIQDSGGAILSTAHEMEELGDLLGWGNDQISNSLQGISVELSNLGVVISQGMSSAGSTSSSVESTSSGITQISGNYHAGGVVSGSSVLFAHDGMYLGRLRPDEIPIIAQQGEFMLSRDDVTRLGGAAQVERLRRGGESRNVVLNVDMSLSGGQAGVEELAEAVGRRLESLARKGLDTSTTRHREVHI